MRLKSSVALTVVLMAAACGAGPRGPGNSEELKALEGQLFAADGVVAGLEAYVSKYPADPEGHSLLARALSLKAEAWDRAAFERIAQHERKVLELSTDASLREGSLVGLINIYMRTGPLNQPAEVIEPAKELIAVSATLSSPHTYLSLALADLKRADEAVQVWSDALRTLRGRARQEIAVGIGYLTLGNELTESHIQTLVTVLTTVANDVENPDPRAQALALTLRAERLEKDPATQKALLEEAVPWKALAAQQDQQSSEALKAEVADLLRRAGVLRK